MADGIPYPQAPQYTPPNPLQQMTQMSELAQRRQSMEAQQQAVEQQALMNAAKMAVGQHMQAHIDPKTGEFNKYGFLGSIAQDQNAALAFPEIYKTLLENGEIEERTAGQHLQNEKSKLDYVANTMAPLNQRIAEGHNVTDSDIAGLIGNWQGRGIFKSREEGLQFLSGMMGSGIGTKENRNQLVRMISQMNENSRGMLNNTLQSMEKRYAPTTIVSETGEKFIGPAARVPGMLPPSGEAPLLPEETAGGGTLAPRSQLPAGQEPSPSEAPATQGVPAGFRREEASPQAQQRVDYLKDTKGEHWLRKAEAEAQDTANMSAQLETNLHQQADVLKNFEQGPLMDARTWTAEKLEGAGLPKTIVDKLMGAKKEGKDAVAAVQVARKGIYTETIEALRQLPGLSRLAVYELQQAKTAVPTIETKKEAADTIFRNMQNTINIAKRTADLTGQYAQWSVGNFGHKRAFNKSALESSIRDMLKHEGLLREGPITTKAPGEE